jgi:hypothetical protein
VCACAQGHKGYEAGGSIAGRGSMEAVDGWIWIVPVVCDPVAADDNSGCAFLLLLLHSLLLLLASTVSLNV